MEIIVIEDEFLPWRLQETLTIEEAVMLMYGLVPEGYNRHFLSGKLRGQWPSGMLPTVHLVSRAIQGEKIIGEIVKSSFSGEVDILKSTVNQKSLIKFLIEQNISDEFFNRVPISEADYLNPSHPAYTPKLAAAIITWKAVVQNFEKVNTLGTPKQRIQRYLIDNADRLGLTKGDGSLNNVAISEIAKVVNWKTKGGVAPTPVSKVDTVRKGGRVKT